MKTVWVTRYALTKGIMECEVDTTNYDGMVTDTNNHMHFFHKPYWHDTEEEAKEHAEKMLLKKIMSVKKQLKKLEEMTF